mmetsp:Transcript_13809/g.44321  ORF Transcript_13809/g.44321 Transcript_13809/m.44321 type:complete len:211 (-) Transcript_13809:1509-2141(-)
MEQSASSGSRRPLSISWATTPRTGGSAGPSSASPRLYAVPDSVTTREWASSSCSRETALVLMTVPSLKPALPYTRPVSRPSSSHRQLQSVGSPSAPRASAGVAGAAASSCSSSESNLGCGLRRERRAESVGLREASAEPLAASPLRAGGACSAAPKWASSCVSRSNVSGCDASSCSLAAATNDSIAPWSGFGAGGGRLAMAAAAAADDVR